MLKLIYDYNLEDHYKTAIEDVLEEVAGLCPTDAAPKLTKVFHGLQSGSIDNQNQKKESKSFFSKLFS